MWSRSHCDCGILTRKLSEQVCCKYMYVGSHDHSFLRNKSSYRLKA